MWQEKNKENETKQKKLKKETTNFKFSRWLWNEVRIKTKLVSFILKEQTKNMNFFYIEIAVRYYLHGKSKTERKKEKKNQLIYLSLDW